MKRLLISLLLFSLFATLTASSPYHIRMRSSVSSTILIGVAGTTTEGDTITGSYTSGLQMHKFSGTKSGFYTLWEDPLGGTSYARRTDWSDATGKYLSFEDDFYEMTNWKSRYARPTLLQALYNNTSSPVNGITFLGESNKTEMITDTTIVLGSDVQVIMPPSYKLRYKYRNVRFPKGSGLFRAFGDSNIVISGGNFYGYSDSDSIMTYGNVFSSAGRNLTVDGLTVTKVDSLDNFYITITAGPASGQTRRLSGNTITDPVEGYTTLHLEHGYATSPTSSSDYRLTAAVQHQHAIDLWECKNVLIQGVRSEYFPGDGICLVGGENIMIRDCYIVNPVQHFHSQDSLGEWLFGRQPISLVQNPAGSTHPAASPFKPMPSPTGLIKNVTIANCYLRGGLWTIDIEPGYSTVEDVKIDNCTFDGGSRAIGIGGYTNTFKNITISNCNFRNYQYIFDLSLNSTCENITFYNCTFDSIQSGGYVSLSSGGIKNLTFKNCIFSNIYGDNSDHWTIFSGGNISNFVIDNCIFKNINWGPIFIQNQAVGGYLENVIITNNKFINTGLSGVAYCIYVSGVDRNLYIANNLIHDQQGAQTYGIYAIYSDSVLIKDNVVIGVSDPINTYGSTHVISSGNVTSFDVAGGGSSAALLANGSVPLDSAWYAVAGSYYHPISDSLVKGEISSKANAASDWGFLRLSAGGGSVVGEKTAIDLNGYGGGASWMRSIGFWTGGAYRARLNNSGLAFQAGYYVNFDTTNVGSGGYGLHDDSGTMQFKHSGGSWLNLFKSVKADPSSGEGLFIRNKNSADADTLILRTGSTNRSVVLN